MKIYNLYVERGVLLFFEYVGNRQDYGLSPYPPSYYLSINEFLTSFQLSYNFLSFVIAVLQRNFVLS